MSEQMHYAMLIQWSEADQAYLVTLPDWEGRVLGPVTHGDTYEDAARNGKQVIEMLVEAALENGEPLPEPRVYAQTLSA
jgi:predicted RNase H-like HicB family nuclease